MTPAGSRPSLGVSSHDRPPPIQGYRLYDVLGRGGAGDRLSRKSDQNRLLVVVKILHPELLDSGN